MAKQRFDLVFNINQQGEEFLYDVKDKKYYTVDSVLSRIKYSIEKKELQGGTKKHSKNNTKYIFKIGEGDQRTTVSVGVPERKKQNIKSLSKLEDLCTTSIKMGKINFVRLVAGMTAFTLTVMGITYIVLRKNEEEYIEKQNNAETHQTYGDSTYEQPDYKEFTDEELSLLAQNGDEVAQEYLRDREIQKNVEEWIAQQEDPEYQEQLRDAYYGYNNDNSSKTIN